jgi:CHAT domain
VPDLQWKIPTPAYDLFEYPRSLATDDPLLESVIVLAGGDRPQAGPEDGLLTGLEVASLRLSGTRLVVLSTCEAGQGTPVDGQGVLGLRAAFSMAGAQGLVMSLWPIDDRAGRQFMQFFYSHVNEGPAEAIRLSQLDMIAKTTFNDPVYWAGYAYSGDPGLKTAARPTTEARATGKSRAAGDDTPMTAPTCIEFETRSADKHYSHRDIYRLVIAGTLNRVSASPDKVVYRLIPPASNLEESHLLSMNGGPELEMDSRSANGSKFPVEVAIVRTEQQSTFTVREYVAEGDYRYKPQDVLLITLKGGAGVLTGFDIPAEFPGLNSFSDATLSRGGQKPVKIDRVATCPAR